MQFVSIEAGVALSLTAGLGYRFWREGVLKSQAEEDKSHEAQERRKLEDEMTSAREIQESLLPATLPKYDGLDIAARYEACLAVGGDYYDFLQLGPSKLLFVIADVQGHGVSSAMIMSNLQATLRNVLHGPQGQSPATLVAALNDALLESTRGERLVTLFLSTLDVSTREFVYVNAGHVDAAAVSTRRERTAQPGGGRDGPRSVSRRPVRSGVGKPQDGRRSCGNDRRDYGSNEFCCGRVFRGESCRRRSRLP